MTVWILHLPLMKEKEAGITRRTHLPLPIDAQLPDLSQLRNEGECRRLMLELYPDDPPESVARRTERVWKLYGQLAEEDVVAVPLVESRQVALAEVSGPYVYRHEGDEATHLLPVKWHPPVALHRFGKHRKIFAGGGHALVEVNDPEERTAIRDRLPHSYNRFVKWKWLMIIFFFMMLLRATQRAGLLP